MRRISIVQGEHVVVTEPHVIVSTVLGSCIAVCLHDAAAKVGGMNHFLLGEPSADQRVTAADMQRYGIHAMEILINEMMKKGAGRDRLRAQIYGGANIVAGLGSIGTHNTAFAKRFLADEGIPVGHTDVGGSNARRVEFLPHEGRGRCVRVAHAPDVKLIAPVAAPVGELELF